MSTAVLLAVLGSALMHGTWNAIAKLIPHRLVSSALIGIAYLVIGGIACLVLPLPEAASVPALLVSVALQTGYLVLLTAAYAKSDFGTIYPLMRGFAIVLVTAVSVGVLGEVLAPAQLLGVLVIVGALAVLALRRSETQSRAGLLLGLAVGATVASYSLVDGIGVRAAGSTLSYAAWLFFLQGLTVPVTCFLLSRERRGFGQALRQYARPGLLGGTLSLLAYGVVVWAQAQAPLALVSALRETGVIAAVFVGWLVFGEKLTARGIGASALVVGGIVLLRLGG
ncbi:EamA family transporter [Brachybacterium hainanense]|uniref:EamA family transporter n=1 Tax=Brachybacterium hainanense TaxID=1541174 RepID=A0ABV6RJK3_9MICO